MPLPEVTVTRATLNTPVFIESSITVVLVITNRNSFSLYNLNLTDVIDLHFINNGYCPCEDSAVMFFCGKKQPVKAKSEENKITLEGLKIPPREKIFVFYRLHKLTD